MDQPNLDLLTQRESFNNFINSVYSDIPRSPNTTERSAYSYKEALKLCEIPLTDLSGRILDVGSGDSPASALDLGITGEYIKTDVSPKEGSGIIKANVLNLPFEDNSFDEVWSLFVLKYVDRFVSWPKEVYEKIIAFSENMGEEIPNQSNFINQISGLMGLHAISELLRVTKVGGKVRIASFVSDFVEGRGFMLFKVWQFLNDGQTGLEITEEYGPITPKDDDREKVMIITKTADFDYNKFSKNFFNVTRKLLSEKVMSKILDS